MKDIVARVMAEPRYLKNIEYGEPSPGHPEGKVRLHIEELEANLEKLAPRISEEQNWKLKFLIHVHDAFKAEATVNAPIESPNSHASLARKFAAKGSYSLERLVALLNAIVDLNLFLMFLIIDGSTRGKDPDKLGWFIVEVRKQKSTLVDESWLL